MAHLKRAGGKITASHSSTIPAAVAIIDAAQADPAVTKMSLGLIENAKSREPRLKFREVPAGWEVIVYGRIYLQHIIIFTSERAKVRKRLEAAFSTD